MLSLLDTLAKHYDCTPEIKLYILASLGKLIGRFSNSDAIDDHLRAYSGSIVVEAQQRSLEYSQLISSSSNIRKVVTAPLPILHVKNNLDDEDNSFIHENTLPSSNASNNILDEGVKPAAKKDNSDNILDDLFGYGSSSPNSYPDPLKSNASHTSQVIKNNQDDLLSSIFGSNNAPVSSNNKPFSNANILDDMFAQPQPIKAVASPISLNSISAFSQNGITVEFQFEKSGNITNVVALITNKSLVEVTNFELKVAVPKVLKKIKILYYLVFISNIESCNWHYYPK